MAKQLHRHCKRKKHTPRWLICGSWRGKCVDRLIHLSQLTFNFFCFLTNCCIYGVCSFMSCSFKISHAFRFLLSCRCLSVKWKCHESAYLGQKPRAKGKSKNKTREKKKKYLNPSVRIIKCAINFLGIKDKEPQAEKNCTLSFLDRDKNFYAPGITALLIFICGRNQNQHNDHF